MCFQAERILLAIRPGPTATSKRARSRRRVLEGSSQGQVPERSAAAALAGREREGRLQLAGRASVNLQGSQGRPLGPRRAPRDRPHRSLPLLQRFFQLSPRL